VQSIVYISTERDFYAHLSPPPLHPFVRFWWNLLQEVCRYCRWESVAFVKIVSRNLTIFCGRQSNYVCACHETVWHFEMKERLGKLCVPCHLIKCVKSCLKNSPTKVDWSLSISIVNLRVHALYFNFFLVILWYLYS